MALILFLSTKSLPLVLLWEKLRYTNLLERDAGPSKILESKLPRSRNSSKDTCSSTLGELNRLDMEAVTSLSLIHGIRDK